VLDILYEDEALIFINKPPQMVVQRGHNPDETVLLDLLNAYTSPIYLLQRLDRGTSGVIFFSKKSGLNVRLTRQFETRRVHKKYLALCTGELSVRQTIDAPLARIGAINFGVREHGRRAVTHIAPLQSTTGASLLSVALETGRTHQIRVHLSAIGHPLVGDWLYGDRDAARPMLHAAELALTHPATQTPLVVRAPLPADFVDEAARCGLRVLSPES
jgi:23S rRNA pseudouridine1911/1915/1917 synthase